VQTITRAAQQISESDLHRRLRLARHDELGELAATFDRMLDRLENAFERQRQFTADASHELRTPLTIIDLEANYALTQPLTLEECQQAITLIQQEARTMARLVNNLLILARADSGQVSIRHDAFDLGDVVLEVVERLSPLAAQQGMTITLGALPELVLLGDRQLAAQALSNLVENALKYCPPVGNQVCISMGSESKTAESAEHSAWLRVTDNGPGIAEEHLPHLFERFYRVDQARTRFPDGSAVPSMEHEEPTGSGLGLCITQWIVETHGGQIHVQSTLGQGATFEVWLPNCQ
jgi:signal transduction histidine kinase